MLRHLYEFVFAFGLLAVLLLFAPVLLREAPTPNWEVTATDGGAELWVSVRPRWQHAEAGPPGPASSPWAKPPF